MGEYAQVAAMIDVMEAALKQVEPPFLALPERGETPETLAYRRGARDAYRGVIVALHALLKDRP
jgi:hypothetical protein